MADSNPFAVNVPSALEALTVGDQSYKAGRDFVQQRQQEQLRQRVAQDILNGGDTRAGIARLIGGGDIAGATALGIHRLAHPGRQRRRLRAQSRHHKVKSALLRSSRALLHTFAACSLLATRSGAMLHAMLA